MALVIRPIDSGAFGSIAIFVTGTLRVSGGRVCFCVRELVATPVMKAKMPTGTKNKTRLMSTSFCAVIACNQGPNAALERLAHATTDKGYSPASPLQALVLPTSNRQHFSLPQFSDMQSQGIPATAFLRQMLFSV